MAITCRTDESTLNFAMWKRANIVVNTVWIHECLATAFRSAGATKMLNLLINPNILTIRGVFSLLNLTLTTSLLSTTFSGREILKVNAVLVCTLILLRNDVN